MKEVKGRVREVSKREEELKKKLRAQNEEERGEEYTEEIRLQKKEKSYL